MDPATYPEIDDVLGDHGGGPPGRGAPATRYELRRFERTPVGSIGVVGVSPDGAGGHERDRAPVPHLSTVDVVVVAALTAERHLEETGRGTAAELARLRLVRLAIRTGDQASEAADGVTVRLDDRDPQRPGDVEVGCRVGAMHVDLTFRPSGAPSGADVPEAAGSYFGEHLREHRQSIRDVTVSRDEVSASVTVTHEGAAAPLRGIESAHAGSLSVLDHVVCLAQLAQVLAHHQDAVGRSDPGAFWLSSLSIELDGDPAPLGTTVSMRGRLTRPRILSTGAQRWRLFTMTSSAPAVGASSSVEVAHALADGTTT